MARFHVGLQGRGEGAPESCWMGNPSSRTRKHAVPRVFRVLEGGVYLLIRNMSVYRIKDIKKAGTPCMPCRRPFRGLWPLPAASVVCCGHPGCAVSCFDTSWWWQRWSEVVGGEGTGMVGAVVVVMGSEGSDSLLCVDV